MTLNTPDPVTPEKNPVKSIFQGMLAIGSGKKEGMFFFPNSSQGVLNALAPWIACFLVTAIIFVPPIHHHYGNRLLILLSISLFLGNLGELLAKILIIQGLASFWKVTGDWKRAVTAMLWCRWMPLLDALVFSLVIGGLFISFPTVFVVCTLLLFLFYFGYSIWISWFTIKSGLLINNKRTLLIIFLFMIVGILFNCILLLNPIIYDQFHAMQAAINHTEGMVLQ